ncbi:hypothetical protein [Deinococcus metallilatus]|uniref:ABC-type nitrate/sulfonate/bicarbonate transport system substrate-binding protein n=1 Tax=Deinococcus metallilatus TaxID=1211322 RepID=A0ABR6MV59_9DEIO|nr:hypothetical protein [Deinococcus metallilatus]MBB5295820.1 ABC-type nitrate/sulfonate/bicarbonate transport system substrate-binding protein [Deinococcus metallilatus]
MKSLLHLKLLFLLVFASLTSALAETAPTASAGAGPVPLTIGGPIDYGLE